MAKLKTYSIGVKYRVGNRTVSTTTNVIKNIRVAPTRSVRAAAARATVAAAAAAARSTRTSAGGVVVSGAGTAEVNGTYVPSGTANGQTSYSVVPDNGSTISFNGSAWIIAAGAFVLYTGGSTLSAPFTVAGGNIGSLPAPLVLAQTTQASSHVLAINVTTPMLASQLRLASVKRGKYRYCANTI